VREQQAREDERAGEAADDHVHFHIRIRVGHNSIAVNFRLDN
jgi:hypothetical protein